MNTIEPPGNDIFEDTPMRILFVMHNYFISKL